MEVLLVGLVLAIIGVGVGAVPGYLAGHWYVRSERRQKGR